MDNRVWSSGASASPPTAPASPSNGYPSSGDPQTATPATKGGAFWFHQIGEELRAVLTAAGITPSTSNNAQLLEAIQRIIDAQSGNYALDTGAANAYVIALDPAIAAYTNGMTVRVKIVNANTGASTLNAGGGAVALVNDVGGALVAGDVPADGIIAATYITSANKFYITSLVPSQSVQAANIQLQSVVHCGTTGGSATAYTCAATPALTANTAKTRIRATLHTAAGATPTLAVNGLAALPIKYVDSSGALQAITSTQAPAIASDFECDGTNWVMLNPVPNTGLKIAVLKYQLTSGTAGTATTAGAFTKILLNTIQYDSIGLNLASNQFTLPAGTYKIDGWVTSRDQAGTMLTKLNLYNATSATHLIQGSTSTNGGTAQTPCHTDIVDGVITVAASQALQLFLYASTAANFMAASSGQPEVYAGVTITKIS